MVLIVPCVELGCARGVAGCEDPYCRLGYVARRTLIRRPHLSLTAVHDAGTSPGERNPTLAHR